MEAGEAVFQLAGQAGGGALDAGGVLGGDEHRDLRRLVAFGARQRAGCQGTQRALGQGQHPRPPLARLRRPRCRVQDQHPGAALQVRAELGGSGDDVAAVGHLAGKDGGDKGTRDFLALPLRRARALQLQRQQRRHHSDDRRLGRPGAAVAQLANGAVGDPQLHPGHLLPTGQQLLLLVRRGTGDSQDGAGAVDQDNAGIEDLGRRSSHAGQSSARLDRLRERVEGPSFLLFCRSFLAFGGGCHAPIIPS
jgi:hypothetical protein